MNRPCQSCPFRRGAGPRVAGKVDPLRLVGQAAGPFSLPCHLDPDYGGAGSDPTGVTPCAGAAVYRANCSYPTPPGVAPGERDTVTVYAGPVELAAGLYGCSEIDAAIVLLFNPVSYLLLLELRRVTAGGEGYVREVPKAAADPTEAQGHDR